MPGGRRRKAPPLGVHRPIAYRGQEALAPDIANCSSPRGPRPTRTSCRRWSPPNVGVEQATNTTTPMRSTGSPIADALREEYKGIVDAGSSCRSTIRTWQAYYTMHPELDIPACRQWASASGRSAEHALRGIPPEPGALPHLLRHQQGSAGPRHVELKDIVDIMLKVNAGALSPSRRRTPGTSTSTTPVEDVKLPEGKA